MDVFSLTKHKCNEKKLENIIDSVCRKVQCYVNHFAFCSQSV